MRLGPGLLYEGRTLQGARPKLADFCSATMAEFYSAVDRLGDALGAMAAQGISMVYTDLNIVVAEGNFVFTASEGTLGDVPTAFFDLFRVEDNRIVEHWDVISGIPIEMAHDNGKF